MTTNNFLIRRWGLLLFSVIGAAIGLRLIYILFLGSTLNLQTSGYDVYAVNLIEGRGYTRFADFHQDSDLPPLYSFFLAGVYSLLGRSAINVALIQTAMDVVTMLAIYSIGNKVGGKPVGLLAAALTGFYPYLLFQNLSVNDTAIFIMLISLGLWCSYRVKESSQVGWAVLAGVSFGLAALTKSFILLLLPFIALWWLHSWRKGILLGGILGIVTIAVLAPWIIRNTQLHGKLTLISTNDGSNLFQGNNPRTADVLMNGWDVQWLMTTPPTGLSEVEESAWFRDQAINYLRDNPGDIPRLMFAKFMTLWIPEIRPRGVPPDAELSDDAVLQYESPVFQAARIIHFLYFTPLLLLGVVGGWLAWRDQRPIFPILSLALVITIAYLIYHPSTRYRVPVDPFLFILSSYGFFIILAKFGQKDRSKP